MSNKTISRILLALLLIFVLAMVGISLTGCVDIEPSGGGIDTVTDEEGITYHRDGGKWQPVRDANGRVIVH